MESEIARIGRLLTFAVVTLGVHLYVVRSLWRGRTVLGRQGRNAPRAVGWRDTDLPVAVGRMLPSSMIVTASAVGVLVLELAQRVTPSLAVGAGAVFVDVGVKALGLAIVLYVPLLYSTAVYGRPSCMVPPHLR